MKNARPTFKRADTRLRRHALPRVYDQPIRYGLRLGVVRRVRFGIWGTYLGELVREHIVG